jgi:thioredoxin 1
VDFTAKWCKPCQEIAPFFHDLSKKYPNATYVSVDVDDLDEISSEAGVKAMPTFQTYKSNKKVREVSGKFEADLEKMVREECSK